MLWVWYIFFCCVGFSLVLCVAVYCEITECGIILQQGEDIMLVVKMKIMGVTDLIFVQNLGYCLVLQKPELV
jgi:hypothetical protein